MSKSPMILRPFGVRDKVGYMLGNVANDFTFIFASLYLQVFYTDVLGISAGSMNMAGAVYVQPEEPGESVPEFRRFAPGLALTPVNILPHYQKVKDRYLDGKRLFEDITYVDSIGNTFFALPDGSYFYQDEEGLLLCGRAYRIKDGILELLTVDEEVLDMTLLA